MTKVVEVKFRLEAGQRERFDERCNAMGVSRTARLGELINADLECRVLAVPPKHKKPKPQKPHPQLTQISEELEKGLVFQNRRIEELSEKLQYIAPATWHENRQKELASLIEDVSAQQTRSSGTIGEIHEQLEQLSQRSKPRAPPPLYKRLDFQTGAVSGIIGFLLLLAVLPGDSLPARKMANFALGERNNVAAAQKLLDDPALQFALATSGPMAKSKDYRSDLLACIKKAQKTKKRYLCTMRLPAIASSK